MKSDSKIIFLIYMRARELHRAQMVYLQWLIATEKPRLRFFCPLNKTRQLNQQSIIIFHNCIYANKNKCPCDHVDFNESIPSELRFIIAQNWSLYQNGKSRVNQTVQSKCVFKYFNIWESSREEWNGNVFCEKVKMFFLKPLELYLITTVVSELQHLP